MRNTQLLTELHPNMIGNELVRNTKPPNKSTIVPHKSIKPAEIGFLPRRDIPEPVNPPKMKRPNDARVRLSWSVSGIFNQQNTENTITVMNESAATYRFFD